MRSRQNHCGPTTGRPVQKYPHFFVTIFRKLSNLERWEETHATKHRVWNLEPSSSEPNTVYAPSRMRLCSVLSRAARLSESFSDCVVKALTLVTAELRWHVPAHNPARSRKFRADLRRRFDCRGIPHGLRGRNLETYKSGATLRVPPRPHGRSGPLRSPPNHACVSMQKHL